MRLKTHSLFYLLFNLPFLVLSQQPRYGPGQDYTGRWTDNVWCLQLRSDASGLCERKSGNVWWYKKTAIPGVFCPEVTGHCRRYQHCYVDSDNNCQTRPNIDKFKKEGGSCENLSLAECVTFYNCEVEWTEENGVSCKDGNS